jgi:hypothetical protein
MSIFELQQERNKQLSQPKIKEAEQAYKPISETYNIVAYYNTMRNGKYEQMTQSKAKIPNQQLSYFSDHLKSSELMKTGKHNLNLHSLLSDRANQLKGYNKPQVYEEKISSASDNKVSDELDQLLNSFVVKIQSGVFDITMSNDIYKIFKIFETSSYLFTTELLEKYDEYIKDVISVFKDKSTIELIKRDFKGTNIRQLLLVLTERIEEMIKIMIEANNKGTNITEKQIILRNFIKNKLLTKLDTSYIKIANAEYKKVDAELKTAKLERNQSLIDALTGRMRDIERVREYVPAEEAIPPIVPAEEAEVASEDASESAPAVSSIPSSTAKKPKISVEEDDIKSARLSELLKYNDEINADYKKITDRIQELTDVLNENNDKVAKLKEDKARLETQQKAINAELDTLLAIRLSKRSELEKEKITELNDLIESNDNTMKSLTATINKETIRINEIDAEIERLLKSRDVLTSRLSQVANDIKAMNDFVDEFADVAGVPFIEDPGIRADGGVPEEKEDIEPPLLTQTGENVSKPNTSVLKASEFYIKDVVKNFKYPRNKVDFIINVNMTKMKRLLSLLGLNISNTAIPDSPLITVEFLYIQFLESNPKLMTNVKPPRGVPSFWF